MGSARNLRHGIMKLRDGTGTPKVIIIPLSEGDLNFTISKANRTPIYDRGTLLSMIEGTQELMTISFTVKYVELYNQSGNITPTLYQALNFEGPASNWISTTELTDNCSDVPTLDLIFEVKSPCRNEEWERILFPKFYFTEISFTESEEYNTLSISGSSLAEKPIITKFDEPSTILPNI